MNHLKVLKRKKSCSNKKKNQTYIQTLSATKFQTEAANIEKLKKSIETNLKN